MTFSQAFIYLLAAVISVPLAKRLGLGSVLGYLFAGVVIGPFCFGLVQTEGQDVMHVAEFGVVMMLFVIGLELRPAILWHMRGPILGLGGAQVLGTAAAISGLALLLHVPWQSAIAVGFILAMSSTAIVLQLLNEKNLMKTAGGKASFAVLLFQDIAVLPILALLPLLATVTPTGDNHSAVSPLGDLPGWQHTLVVLAAIAAVILAGRFLLRPFFRYIAATHLREMFTVTALLLVVGIALLMERVGLSPALGAFLAGVVLAESEYRQQLETDIEPFKGLLLGLFFISVGAGINFALIARSPGIVASLVVAILVVKFLVLLAVSRYSRLEPTQRYLFAFALAQGGEFAFVLCSFATQNGVLTSDMANLLVVTVALTMAAAPVLMTINERLVQPRFASVLPEREPDEIDERDNPVVVAGVGRFGHIVARLLRLNGYGTTVLDHDAEQVETLGRFGIKSLLRRCHAARSLANGRRGAGAAFRDRDRPGGAGAKNRRSHPRTFSAAADPRARHQPAACLRVAAPRRAGRLPRDFRKRSSSECRRAGCARPAQRPRPARRATLSRTRERFCPRDGAIRYGGYERLRVHGPSPHRKPGERPGLG